MEKLISEMPEHFIRFQEDEERRVTTIKNLNSKKGFTPHTEREVAEVTYISRCLTEKVNNVRLDRWHSSFKSDEVALNCVCDANVRFERRKRLANRSHLFVDKLLEKKEVR